MINAVTRPLWAAACLISVLLPGLQVQAQYIGDDVIQAQQIDAAMLQTIDAYVSPLMDTLTAESPNAKAVTEARVKLLRQLEDAKASPAFLDAFSKRVTSKMDAAVNHKSVLVRLNAMIVITKLTDEGSKALIDAGLEDDNVAVQRWAMEALRKRVLLWKDRADSNLRQKQLGVIAQVDAKLAKPPHPIVVTPALQVYIDIDIAESRDALITALGNRLELHEKDPSISYAAEQAAIGRFSPIVQLSSPFDIKSGTGLSRVAFNHARQIIKQAKANKFDEETLDGAMAMLNQSVLALGQVAAGARKQPPVDQAKVSTWIKDGNLDSVEKLLVNQWAVLLRAAPFSLTDEELGLK